MEKSGGELKHLGFVRVAALNAVVCASILYDYAKENSGSLKSTVGTVENAVTTVIRPVYERFKGAPDDVLVFLDKKVDELSTQFNEHAPPLAKKIVSKAQQVVERASKVAVNLAIEAKASGLYAAISHTASLSKSFAASQLAVLWHDVSRYPPLHAVGDMALPTISVWSQKYNRFISKMDSRGYHAFGYFPAVPVDDMVKAYKQAEATAGKKDDVKTD